MITTIIIRTVFILFHSLFGTTWSITLWTFFSLSLFKKKKKKCSCFHVRIFSFACHIVFVFLAFGWFSIYISVVLVCECFFRSLIRGICVYVTYSRYHHIVVACNFWTMNNSSSNNNEKKIYKATRNYVRIYSLIIMLTSSMKKKINLIPHLICALGKTEKKHRHHQHQRRHYFANSWRSKWKLKLIEIDVLNTCLSVFSFTLVVCTFLHPCSITPNHYSFVLTHQNKTKKKEISMLHCGRASFVVFFTAAITNSTMLTQYTHYSTRILSFFFVCSCIVWCMHSPMISFSRE